MASSCRLFSSTNWQEKVCTLEAEDEGTAEEGESALDELDGRGSDAEVLAFGAPGLGCDVGELGAWLGGRGANGLDWLTKNCLEKRRAAFSTGLRATLPWHHSQIGAGTEVLVRV